MKSPTSLNNKFSFVVNLPTVFLFFQKKDKIELYVLSWVDDLATAGNNVEDTEELEELLK